MITFQQERLNDVRAEITPLLDKHYKEIALHQDAIPLAPDWARYASLEELGVLAIYTAREDGRLIGYSVFFVTPHIHYETTLVASNDLLFVDPEYRGGSTGLKLIRFSEQALKERGVKKVTWHCKFSNGLQHLLNRLGYADEEVIVGKIL
jgi:GNAT superfamily N-acetyltransferase